VPGLRQWLVSGHRRAGQTLGGAADDRGETVGVTLEQRDPTPVLQAPEQLGEVQVLPSGDERVLVRGVELRLPPDGGTSPSRASERV
jgi:hypothetical protein